MTDIAIAVLSAGADSPLSVAFLDMNGLKTINDKYGHAAGDEAIRAYFQAILATVGTGGEAYRGNGGDEVVVLLPNVTDEKASELLSGFVRYLGKESLFLGDEKVEWRLTASCGSVSTSNPNEQAKTLYRHADTVQYRAKAKARECALRASTIAIGDGEVTTYTPGQTEGGTVDAAPDGRC